MGRPSVARWQEVAPVVKRKKTGVRSPRKTSARPTRAKPSPKLREGGRQSSPFSTKWKYLDLDTIGERTTPKDATAGRGGKGKGRRPSSNAVATRTSPRALTYYEPPPKRKAFRDFTDDEIIAYYLALPGDRRRHVLESTATWKWFNAHKRDHKLLIANADRIKAGLMMTPPSTTEIATYMRLYAGLPCSCGYLGYPWEDHTLDARKCFKLKPAALLIDDEEDDDLPF
jgi:hypothetical protein